MSMRDRRREPDDENNDEVSFADVVDLGSIPPASGQVDVHRAPTAVTTMTDELMDEIRRAKEDAKLLESVRTRIQPKFQEPAVFQDETPTRPGKDKPAAAVPVPEPEAPPSKPVAFPETKPAPKSVSFAETIPAPKPNPPAVKRRRLWPHFLLWTITIAALLVSAFAVRRYRARLMR
jgi:hypothetical protein